MFAELNVQFVSFWAVPINLWGVQSIRCTQKHACTEHTQLLPPCCEQRTLNILYKRVEWSHCVVSLYMRVG